MPGRRFWGFCLLAGWLAAAGCSGDASPPHPGGAAGLLDRSLTSSPDRGGGPEYHQPPEWWRSSHGRLTARDADPANRYFRVEECLICHDLKRSCRRCHEYVGVARKNAP